jgi:hypothetical protein
MMGVGAQCKHVSRTSSRTTATCTSTAKLRISVGESQARGATNAAAGVEVRLRRLSYQQSAT